MTGTMVAEGSQSVSTVGAQRTGEEMAAVDAHLEAKNEAWTTTVPNYTDFDRDQLLRRLDDVAGAIVMETDADGADVARALRESQDFVHASFDFFEGRRDIGRSVSRAFCVPMRSTRDDDANASESTPFIPLYDPNRFAVSSDKRMRGIYGLPPTVLDTYTKSDCDRETGALVLVPMYSDMLNDIWPDRTDFTQAAHMADVAATVLRASARFAHLRLGARVLGLGAILPHPTMTNFGRKLHEIDGMQDLVTTTGHGGTVCMVVNTVKKILSETSIQSRGRIGVIGGAGSIGWSTTVATLEMIDGHEIYSYDKRLNDLRERASLTDNVIVASSVADVLRNANVIVAAVTGTIDLDDDEFADLDLDGKVIIDDSQPGCFDRGQVEARRGKLVWVVGEDGSDSEFITRDGLHTNGVPYNYGNNAGLYGRSSEFACGQEAAVIAQHGAYDRAITGPVTPENVREIGKLFADSGVRVAPFQAFGQPVWLD
jgi:hypothetical protein